MTQLENKKFKLLALIDDRNYTLNEIYQQQLYRELAKKVDLTIITLEDISQQAQINLNNFDGIFCSIRFRNTLKYGDVIGGFLKEKAVIVNDFDPWNNFIDSSPYKNSYHAVNKKLNVKSFFVSADHWAKRLQEQNLPSCALQIGMESELILNTKNFEEKNRLIEFRGSAHPLRIEGHRKLQNAGLNVPWLESVKPYSSFLTSINDLKIWCHNESEPIIVDGKNVCFNALWPKAIEVLARGCFVIRDFQEESVWYEMQHIPTVLLFDKLEDAKDKLEMILSMREQERNERIKSAIDFLLKKQYWSTFVDTILDEFN